MFTVPGEEPHTEATLWWWDEWKSRRRLSWQTTMNYHVAVVFVGLEPSGTYTIRTSGYGKFLLRIDGQAVGDADDRVEIGETRDFRVPNDHLADRKLVLTWDQPEDEGELNWRQKSRLAEVWLIKE